MMAAPFLEIRAGITGTAEQAPVVVQRLAVEDAVDAQVMAAGYAAARAQAAVGGNPQLGHVMHPAQLVQTLRLQVFRVAADITDCP